MKFFIFFAISVLTLFSLKAEILTLDEAVKKAFLQNPQVMASTYNIEASKEKEKRSYSGYMPSLSFTTSYARQTGNAVARPGVPVNSDPDNDSFNNYSLGITLNQTIYDFGRTTGATDIAEAQVKSDVQDANVLKLSVWELVCLRYSLVLTNQELVNVAERNAEASKKHLEQATALFESGAKPKLDKLRLEVELKNAEASLIFAASSLKTSKNDLLAAMGIKDFYDFTVQKFDISEPVTLSQDISSIAAQAVDTRPETAAVKEKIKLSEKTLKTVKSDFFPVLGLTATFSDAGTDITDLAWNWGVGIGFTWPIFTGLTTYRSMKEAEKKLLALKLSLTAIEIQVRTEIEQAAENIKAADARIEAYKAALTSSREAADAAESRYKAGSGNIIELLDAQTGLANSEANLVKAFLERDIAYIRWHKAFGKIPEKHTK